MQLNDSPIDRYKDYLSLTPKQRMARIKNAEQDEKQRRENPQANHQFPETNFIKFTVEEDGNIIQLKTFKYEAVGKPRALLFMFHGLNSHLGHGAHIAHEFSKAGITTVGFDHRGFGQSEGKPGYVQSLESHLRDSLSFVEMVSKKFKGLPTFVLGLSMGGMTSYYLSLHHRELFEGAILMAPALMNIIGSSLVCLTKGLTRLLPKGMKLVKPIYGKASKNPQISEDVKEDKLSYHGRACLSTINMLICTMDKSLDTFGKYSCPFLIVQGGLDKMVNPMVAFQLYQRSETEPQDKDILFYENMWHDIWHEKEIHQIVHYILRWIYGRLALISK